MEFALILVPLMLILGGIIQFGLVYGTQIGIENATRETARRAVLLETWSAADASANGATTIAYLTASSGGALAGNVQGYLPGNLVTGASGTRVCYSAFVDPSGDDQVRLTVTTVYRHPLFLPIIGSLVDALDGTADNSIRVSVSQTMRVENMSTGKTPSLSGASQCVSA